MADTTQQHAATQQVEESTTFPLGWIAVSLGAHTAWGLYPVLARYLQTVSGLPAMAILTLGNLIVLMLIGYMLVKKTPWRLFTMPITWVFTFFVILRAVTNILSTRYTLSIYVQLITQATPFIVIFISTLIFSERLPRFTIPAVSISLVGALMMIGTDFANIPGDPLRQDWLGITLALVSVVALSTYMVLIRRATRQHIASEALLLIQLVWIIIVGSITSLLLGEDWSSFTRLGLSDWAIFFAFTLIVFLGGNIGQIVAIRKMGAPFHSSLLASRLVSALIFGGLLLNEHLDSLWQMLGAGIVLVTITVFLWQQDHHPA